MFVNCRTCCSSLEPLMCNVAIAVVFRQHVVVIDLVSFKSKQFHFRREWTKLISSEPRVVQHSIKYTLDNVEYTMRQGTIDEWRRAHVPRDYLTQTHSLWYQLRSLLSIWQARSYYQLCFIIELTHRTLYEPWISAETHLKIVAVTVMYTIDTPW